MLQWMGGSRRKIYTSRKSTRSRQKQYFEQRKRQKLGIGTEYNEELRQKNLHEQEKINSLDVLSLTHLAKEANKCSAPNNNASVETAWTSSKLSSKNALQYLRDPCNDFLPYFPLDDGRTSCEMLIKSTSLPGLKLEKRNLPSNDILMKQKNSSSSADGTCDPESSIEVVLHSPIKAKDNFNNCKQSEKEPRLDCRKTRSSAKKDVNSENSISILDLVGDDQLYNESEDQPSEEHHVAFSVKGLGKISMKTPPHTPRKTVSFRSPTSSSVWVDNFQIDCERKLSTLDDDSFLNSKDPWEFLGSQWHPEVSYYDTNRLPHLRKKGKRLDYGLHSFRDHFSPKAEELFSNNCNETWDFDNIRTTGEFHITDTAYGVCENQPFAKDFDIYRPHDVKSSSSSNNKFKFPQGARHDWNNLKNLDIHELDCNWLAPGGSNSSLWHQSTEEENDTVYFNSPRYRRDPNYRSSPKRNSGPMHSRSVADAGTDNASLLSEESCSTAAVGNKSTASLTSHARESEEKSKA